MRMTLLAVLSLAALLAGAADALTVDRWLVRGPDTVPALLFGDGAPVLAVVNVDARPGADDAWAPRDKADFGKADTPRSVLLAAYLDLDRYAEVTIEFETDARAVLTLAGEDLIDLAAGDGEGEGTTTLPRGRYLLMVRAGAVAGERLRVKVNVEAEGAELSVGLDPAHLLTRFDDDRLFTRVSALALSPDAERLLVLLRDRQSDGSRHGVLELWDVAGKTRLATLASGSPGSPGWLPSGRACTWRQDGAVYVYDLESGGTNRLLIDEPDLDRIEWSPDERFVYFLSAEDESEAPDNRRLTELRDRLSDWNDRVVFTRMETTTGTRSPLTATGDFQVMNFALSQDGRQIALVRKAPREGRPFFFSEIWVMGSAGADPRLLTTLQYGFEIWPDNLAWSPDGSRIAFTGPAEEVGAGHAEHNWATTHVWMVSATGGAVELTSKWSVDDRSGAGLCWDGDEALFFVSVRGHKRFLSWDPIDHREPGWLVATRGPVSITPQGFAHVFASELRRESRFAKGFEPGHVAVTRQEADHTPTSEILSTPEGPDAVFADVEPFVFTNESGHEIDGWLYWPPGEAREDLPLIVYYYAGAISTMGGFNFTHQWLAANGYAVYVLNPRGAHSYGQYFSDSHVNDWGERADADIIAGVTALLDAHPEIDGKKVGCYGGSYGGFTTMSLLTKTDLFAAAVSMYGISNLASYWGEGIWGYTYGDMALAGSYPWNRPDLFTGKSPLYHADRIDTPLLLLHGADDANVPPGESEQMFTALKVLGRDVELVRFAGEDHGLGGSWENRVAHRTMLLEYFDRWLRDRPAAWEARWQQ